MLIPKPIPTDAELTFPCPKMNCNRIFLKPKWLEKHIAADQCKLSKSHRRKSRSKNIITKRNALRDVAIQRVGEGDFHERITLVRPIANRQPATFDVQEKKKKYKLYNGQKWVPSMLSLGYGRKMRWSSRTKYTTKQIGFLKWAFSLCQNVTELTRKSC
jgi:hypothetical protein